MIPFFDLGDEVLVRWPGSADGTDSRLVRVCRIRPEANMFSAHVARVNARGATTGEWGTSARSFTITDVLSVVRRNETQQLVDHYAQSAKTRRYDGD